MFNVKERKFALSKRGIVQKCGRHLANQIPQEMVEHLRFAKNSKVEWHGDGHEIKMKKRENTLDELMSQITPENQHDEVDWGKPEGEETW